MGRLCWKSGERFGRKRKYFMLNKKSSYRGYRRKCVVYVKKNCNRVKKVLCGVSVV